jgi:hypothetical protein
MFHGWICKIDDGLVVRRAALSVLEVVVSMMRSGAVAGGSSSAIATPLQACLVDKEEIQVKAYNVRLVVLILDCWDFRLGRSIII